ncbi:peptidylprolyl isomerase [Akkermansia muciniphila]|uniref:peptidylprolyl isomerase n=1 Tax=Akkermansia muciniphila TaxID=239935 RepID=UPI0016515331|nr:peptidylprolyl isomerase [Akkermansia muciniphila]
MNIRTHIQALLICTLPLSAQGQSIVDSRASLPRAVQLHGDEGRETVRPDESKRISPNEAPASRVQPQRIVNRIAATVNGRPITANEVSVRLMPIGAQLAAQYPKQGPEFYKQLALAKKNIIEDLVERELLRNEFEGMGGVIRDSLIDQEVNRTILTTFNGDRSAFLKNLSLSGMTIRAFREMTKKQLQVQIMRASKYDQEIPPTPEEIQQEYESTKEQYRDLTKDKIKFKKIFIPMLGDDSASTPEVQLNLAELIAKEIKSKNATFEEMAKRYSKDLYAEKGGDWPVTERSTLSPESAAIIFGAQPGEIIGPLVDSTGFTIVLVEKKELAPPPPSPPSRSRLTSWRATSAAMNVIKNGWNASGKKPSSKYTSDSSPFPIAGPAHSTRPVRRSLFHFPCFSFRQPFRPLSFSCRGHLPLAHISGRRLHT